MGRPPTTVTWPASYMFSSTRPKQHQHHRDSAIYSMVQPFLDDRSHMQNVRQRITNRGLAPMRDEVLPLPAHCCQRRYSTAAVAASMLKLPAAVVSSAPLYSSMRGLRAKFSAYLMPSDHHATLRVTNSLH